MQFPYLESSDFNVKKKVCNIKKKKKKKKKKHVLVYTFFFFFFFCFFFVVVVVVCVELVGVQLYRDIFNIVVSPMCFSITLKYNQTINTRVLWANTTDDNLLTFVLLFPQNRI